MIYAVCASFVVIYGLTVYCLFTYVWRREEKQAERERLLLEHALNPRAAEAAAFHRALEFTPPPLPDLDGEDDDRFGRDVTEDYDFIAIGDDA